MPRRQDRGRRGGQRRRAPAVRIHVPRHGDEGADADRSIRADPLDRLQTIQPTDLVPRSTGDVEAIPRPMAVDDAAQPVEQEPSLEEYVHRIEASAARLRAEQAGDASGLSRPRARTAGSPTSEQEQAQTVARRRRVPGGRRRRRLASEPPKPWYRRRRTWFIAAMVVPLLFVATATAYVLNIVRLSVDAYGEIHEEPVKDRVRYTVNAEGTAVPVPSAEIEEVLPNWEDDEPINIVLLGVDTRVGDDQPPRSDTTIVVHIDPGTDEVTMMSIPRDLLVYIPGYGEDKFNAAYPIGEANEEEIPGGGPTLVAQTVEANFNIPIHYFATIDFEGFKEVVDTVGGVVVDVDTQLTDNLYPTDDLRLTRVYFSAGLQKMDGETALQYVRTRHADSDIGRSERQQQVLMAIREQAISRDLITQAQSLIQDMKETVRTDLSFNEMLALANLGRNVQPDDIARLNLWEEGLLTEHLPEFDGDAYYLAADWDAVLVRPAPTSAAKRRAQATRRASASRTRTTQFRCSSRTPRMSRCSPVLARRFWPMPDMTKSGPAMPIAPRLNRRSRRPHRNSSRRSTSPNCSDCRTPRS
ncbi:MAG: LCP family protein [Thermomicrobiales bacterium]